MRRAHHPSWVLALVIAAFPAGCATPFSDSDASPGEARVLQLNVEHSDRLACQDERQPDCIDWFALELPEAGEMRLEVTAASREGLPLEYTVILADDRTDPLERASNQGRREVRMTWSGGPGSYLIAVSSGPTQAEMQYAIVAWYQPAGAAEARDDRTRRFETSSWMVLEVESEMGRPRFVIIDGGRKNGLHRGFRGRLIERGRAIAEIEIVDVFEEGSRARIATELVDRITPQTAAEVDVPAGSAP
jgi:hypothetical protein